MKERPILFSGAMVRALLAGTKTQTRRPLYTLQKFSGRLCMDRRYPPPLGRLVDGFPDTPVGMDWSLTHWRDCKPGDRLWVRETWAGNVYDNRFLYRADLDEDEWVNPPKWRPSIHMPRSVSRLTLEVTAVRVERLQAISEADAQAEGIDPAPGCRPEDDAAAFHRIGKVRDNSYSIARYAVLWESINGAGSWKVNPWVWVISFTRVEAA